VGFYWQTNVGVVSHSNQARKSMHDLSYWQTREVKVNIYGVKTKAYFEVIEIMNDSNHYPALLGIDLALDNIVVMNLKQRKMSFMTNTLHVIAPLDLA
jgi:hypothetical protein